MVTDRRGPLPLPIEALRGPLGLQYIDSRRLLRANSGHSGPKPRCYKKLPRQNPLARDRGPARSEIGLRVATRSHSHFQSCQSDTVRAALILTKLLSGDSPL
jgi:hypothetical protein